MKIQHLRKIVWFKNNPFIRSIILYLKDFYDKTIETNAQLKQQFLQFLPFSVAAITVGIVAFLYSVFFSYCERLSFYIYEFNHLLIFVSTPLCFLLSWWLVKRFAPYSKGSGIPQVMASVELAKPKTHDLIHKFLSLKIIFIKILSSGIKVIGGGILGREGPTIQIASTIFNEINKRLPKWWMPISQKNMVIAGAASGLAAAFNTPLGGIIFSIEELSKFHIRYYKSPLFIGVIISGLTAQGLGGSYLYLGNPKVSVEGWIITVGIVLVSITSGYFASKMCVILLKIIHFFNTIQGQVQQLFIVLGCAFFVATFIYIFGSDAMGSGKNLMERVLFTEDKSVAWYLPFIRMNGLIATFSFGGAGGVFAPSLSAGASFGAIVAHYLHLNDGTANLLILIGMTTFLTGVTRAPFTSAIIVFEMTDRHSVIFFLLLGAIIANLVASFVDKHSFYDHLKETYLEETLQQASLGNTHPKEKEA